MTFETVLVMGLWMIQCSGSSAGLSFSLVLLLICMKHWFQFELLFSLFFFLLKFFVSDYLSVILCFFPLDVVMIIWILSTRPPLNLQLRCDC